MALPPPTVQRSLKHTRTICIDAYARDDGLWDIDARINDIKTRDFALASGVRASGAPIYDLSLRLTVDQAMTIYQVEAVSDAVPYQNYCNLIGPDYKKLVGLNLMRQFRSNVKARLGGTLGCTHLTELAQILPTAVLQAFAGEVLDTRDGGTSGSASKDDSSEMPFQLNRCHALRQDAPAVLKFYPRWAQSSQIGN